MLKISTTTENIINALDGISLNVIEWVTPNTVLIKTLNLPAIIALYNAKIIDSVGFEALYTNKIKQVTLTTETES